MSNEHEHILPPDVTDVMRSISDGIQNRDEVEDAQKLVDIINPVPDKVRALVCDSPELVKAEEIDAGFVLLDHGPEVCIRVKSRTGDEYMIVPGSLNDMGNLAMSLMALMVSEEHFAQIESLLIDMGYLSRTDDDD